MANADVQINWGAGGAADTVAAARLALQNAAKPTLARAVGLPPRSGAAPSRTVRLKSFRAVGGAVGMPGVYALATLLMIGAGIAGVWKANVAFAPEMYDNRGLVPAVTAFKSGQNYAVFDLNLNIRRLRELHVAKFKTAPEVVLIGASQWQEAHAGLMKTRHMYNGHIHRDYWEDLLGQVEIYARNKRLPKQMIIAIRDKQFTPVEQRKDFLWEPGIANYEAMAKRLGIETEDRWRTMPYQRIKERLSLSMLFNNVTRWFNASARPHATSEEHFEDLDTLLPDGSILWSGRHKAIFTRERAEREAIAHADNSRHDPPVIDPKGVAAFDKLLAFLKDQGTEVTLVHPPFNPIFWEHVKGGTFFEALDNVQQVTRDLAAKYGLKVIGDFDPAKVGCTSEMFIDPEHSNPDCVSKIIRQFDDLNRAADAAAKGTS